MSRKTKYFMTGLKLFLVLLLGSLIMIIPTLLTGMVTLFNATLGMIMWIFFLLVTLAVNGWLVIKFRRWIFKGI